MIRCSLALLRSSPGTPETPDELVIRSEGPASVSRKALFSPPPQSAVVARQWVGQAREKHDTQASHQ